MPDTEMTCFFKKNPNKNTRKENKQQNMSPLTWKLQKDWKIDYDKQTWDPLRKLTTNLDPKSTSPMINFKYTK